MMSGGFGDSRTASFVFDFGNSAVFRIHLDYFMGCNTQIVNTAFKRSLNNVDR